MASWIRLAIICAFGTVGLPAAEAVNINGVVIDVETRLPIAGAEVALRYSISAAHIDTATSDKAGEFRFAIQRAAAYTVEASAEGYFGTEYYTRQPSITIDERELAGTQPSIDRKITVALSRTAAITGELRDGPAQRPLAGFTVKAIRTTWYRGKRQFSAQGTGATDEKGAFRINVPPGDYLLEILKAPVTNRIVAERQPDYSPPFPIPVLNPVVFWPLGDPATVLPIAVRGGVDSGVGNINLSAVPMGRVRGAIPLSQCTEGQAALVHFESDPIHEQAVRGDLRIACGGAYTIANLSPGKYRIQIAISDPEAGGFAYFENGVSSFRFRQTTPHDARLLFASADVRIEEGSDIDLDMPFDPRLDIGGKVECECAEGWDKTIRNARVDLLPIGITVGTVDGRNTFQIIGNPLGPANVALLPLPRGLSFQHVLSNGVVTGNHFVPATHAAEQSLTIVLTDRPARIAGAVYRDGDPIAGARVAVARWPLSMFEGFPEYELAECDKDGAFRVDKLPAGIYRAVGVEAGDWNRSDMPGVLADWLTRGMEFTVAEGERKTLGIELASRR